MAFRRSTTPRDSIVGLGPNAMERGEYGEWNQRLRPLPAATRCEPTVYHGEGGAVLVSRSIENYLTFSIDRLFASSTASLRTTLCHIGTLVGVGIG